MPVKVHIKRLNDQAILPKRMTEHAAGYDIFSSENEIIELKPGERKLISTGFSIALPETYEAQIRPRSGLAIKNGVTVLNSPGTIDADYRGEVKVILINHGSDSFFIEPGSRIAQMIISKHEIADFEEVSELSDTDRGTGGFGSTQIK
jgi:dUTP pyrophosphatase